MNYDRITHLIDTFDRYVQHHIPTGSFLRACLENDLREAVARADHQNIHLLPEVVSYMYNELPFNCWGSPERVKAWLSRDQDVVGEIV